MIGGGAVFHVTGQDSIGLGKCTFAKLQSCSKTWVTMSYMLCSQNRVIVRLLIAARCVRGRVKSRSMSIVGVIAF